MQKAKQVALQVSPWPLYAEERDLPTHVRSDLFQQLYCVAWEAWEVVNFLIACFISKLLISVTSNSYIYCAKNRTPYSVAIHWTVATYYYNLNERHSFVFNKFQYIVVSPTQIFYYKTINRVFIFLHVSYMS